MSNGIQFQWHYHKNIKHFFQSQPEIVARRSSTEITSSTNTPFLTCVPKNRRFEILITSVLLRWSTIFIAHLGEKRKDVLLQLKGTQTKPFFLGSGAISYGIMYFSRAFEEDYSNWRDGSCNACFPLKDRKEKIIAYFASHERRYLDQKVGSRYISTGGPISWPPCSQYLTPCDFFHWGYIKCRVLWIFFLEPQANDKQLGFFLFNYLGIFQKLVENAEFRMWLHFPPKWGLFWEHFKLGKTFFH